jgi:hypothetical protein
LADDDKIGATGWCRKVETNRILEESGFKKWIGDVTIFGGI